MPNRRRAAAVVALLLAVAAITVAPASSTSSSSASAGNDGDVEVIRVTAVTAQDTFLDLGETGESLGDQSVISEDLFRQGKNVGKTGVVCTVVRIEEAPAVTLQCVATAELPRGQITAQGLITFTEAGPGRSRLAITGGTGRYRTAHGVVLIEELSGTENRLTFRVIR
jgi:hypothetical protein